MSTPTGIEAAVCQDIAARQKLGIAKYPTQLSDNHAPLSERIQHSYEENLDGSNYLKWAHVEALRMEAALGEAWTIINVLTMMDVDRKEPWPRALEWLAANPRPAVPS